MRGMLGTIIFVSLAFTHPNQQSPAKPLMSVAGAFFALSVADLESSERWYREHLGLAVIMKAPRTDATMSAATVLQGGGLTVELVKHDEAAPLRTGRPAGGGALYVHGIFKVGVVVDNYDETLGGVRARGIPIAIGPFPARAGQPANFIIRDNAGNYIQIFGKP
ncbi:MAG TPA: VOC family protein [Gemmatimonadaceae bacterium]|nr:VOC family protein [Gemmatimonadaceae bacterium]